MSGRASPRVYSIPPGAPFLPTLAASLLDGSLIPDFCFDGDPLALADVTIYVPTRRAARALRGVFVDAAGGRSAILPVIKPLGEFDEDEAAFEAEGSAALDLAPPVSSTDRLLLLAPLVRAWKRRLPAHVAALFEEEVVVPASATDAIWLARDLAGLMDEIETEGSDWAKLAGLVTGELSGWWQVTLDFLSIVTSVWPDLLAERDQSNPAAHRSALIRLEAERLRRSPPVGPVIAAGSTGSIPATAELLAAIARLQRGAVVLPGLDATLDELAKVGTVLSRETGTDDVTGTYVDTQSRVASMQASVARVRALMGRATKLADVVSLEGELSRREADLEALQTQLATLKDAVALSPVTVRLTTDVAPVPEPAPTGFVAGLTAGWHAFTSSVTVVLTGLGALLPFAGLAALVGVPAVLWWRRRPRPVAEAAEGSPAAG